MDKTLKITTAVLIVGIIGFAAFIGWNWFAQNAYRSSHTGTFSYTLNITTDSPLTNVTFFIPVPEDKGGNSPIVSQFSSHSISGIPRDWDTTLYSTGKSTLVKITAQHITPPAGTTPRQPYEISFSVANVSPKEIDTTSPVETGVMFKPAEDLTAIPCANGTCYRYGIPVYADYTASPGAIVTIASTLSGRNDWKLIEPAFNEYHAAFTLRLTGENHGWSTASGTLTAGIGSYDHPAAAP